MAREREVAVKVLRPGMKTVIDKDVALMYMMAGWVESSRTSQAPEALAKWWPSSTTTSTMSWT